MTPDQIDHRIIQQLQGDLPLTPRPFAELAADLGISEAEYLERLRRMRKAGILRRIATVLRHRESGYRTNAMVVWNEDEERADQVGARLAGIDQISHCYLRQADTRWSYNMYAMVHARSEAELADLLTRMEAVVGHGDLTVIRSIKEYKKTSMKFGNG